jgi:LPXTG-motif cell wall-anchored protein
MKVIKKFIAFVLLLSLINLYVPAKIHAMENIKKLEGDIIEYEPESSTTVEKKLPSTGGGRNWIWAIIGAALIGGIVAAIGGGGGSGGDDDDDDDTGDYNYSW